ncbi:MAG: DNA internalization-related competence protein ComEC/Rec2, partial [Bradymonadaceae bacterium]
GVFLPLITVNCAILGGSLFMVERDYTFAESVVFGFGSGTGWALALIALAAVLTGVDPRGTGHEFAEGLGDDRLEAVIEGYVVQGPTPALRGWSMEVVMTSVDVGPWAGGEEARIRLFYPSDVAESPRPLPLPGDRIEVFARLERFPPDDFPGMGVRGLMENRGLAGRGTVREGVEIVGREPGVYLGLIRRLTIRRLHFERGLYRTLEGDARGVAAAMLTASRGWMTAEFREPFDRTGTSHLLAISGLHLGVLGALLWFLVGFFVNRSPRLLRRYGRRRASAYIVVTMLAGYMLMIGAPTSARRALLMVVIGVLASGAMRSFCSIHALCLAAVVLIVFQPSIVHEIGFQLSFAATLGILVFWRQRPAWLRRPVLAASERRRDRLKRRLGTFLGVSTSATLCTWPILWPSTGEIALSSVWLNWIVVPLVSALVFPILLAGGLLLEIVPPVGAWLLIGATEAMVVMQGILEQVAWSPIAGLRPGVPGPWIWLWTTLAIIWLVARGFRRRSFAGALLLVGVGVVPLVWTSLQEPPKRLQVHFIPVGQGDATLVEFWDGTTALVDAGGRAVGSDPGLTVVAPYLRRRGVRRLDWVIITHAHQDHMGGLGALIGPFRPQNFVYDAGEESRQLKELTGAMEDAGAVLHGVEDTLELEISGLTLSILRPGGSYRGSMNDVSLVTRFEHGPAGVLLPGDVEEESEAWLVEQGLEPATLVKMPHHGSRTSSTEEFLEALRPAVAVASAGRHNHFGHPHGEVLARYERMGAGVWRTDEHGLIIAEIEEDGRILVRAMRD